MASLTRCKFPTTVVVALTVGTLRVTDCDAEIVGRNRPAKTGAMVAISDDEFGGETPGTLAHCMLLGTFELERQFRASNQSLLTHPTHHLSASVNVICACDVTPIAVR